MDIYVSGLHRGPGAPGVGTARSLRAAYPDAKLVGVDYSSSSPGLHWHELHELWTLPSWGDVDLVAHGRDVAIRAGRGSVWMSGIDLEALWLSESHDRWGQTVLVPAPAGLNWVMADREGFARRLGLVPLPMIPATASNAALHAFGRLHGWRVCLQGPMPSQAQPVRTWSELLATRRRMSRPSVPSRLDLQVHLTGARESVALAAFAGELLDACHMVSGARNGQAPFGAIDDVPPEMLAPLRDLVAELAWTGGAEIDMVRDSSGRRWLQGFNPHLPAWIYGATLAGRNLPALLVRAATGQPCRPAPSQARCFTSVVIEIPVRRGADQAPWIPREDAAGGRQAGPVAVPAERPSSEGLGSRPATTDPPARLDDHSNGRRPVAGPTAGAFDADLDHQLACDLPTPRHVFLPRSTAERWRGLKSSVAAAGQDKVRLLMAYSIKTNPDDEALALARRWGLLAEAISQLEVDRAIVAGFLPGDIILNGPGKWWPSRINKGRLRAVFCDSLTELRQTTQWLADGDHVADVVGIRLKPPGFASRFGIPVLPRPAFDALVSEVARIGPDVDFGVHFHIPPSVIGVQNWWSLFRSMLSWGAAVEAASGTAVRCVDLGGGWHPDDWTDHLQPRLPELVETAAARLVELRQLMLEPGKALVQPAMAVLSTVLEVRARAGGGEAVLDASISEVPEAGVYPHRVFVRRRTHQSWEPLQPGSGRVLGRSCMESDILVTDIALPAGLRAGDAVAIADAGAYDRSKSYVFGRG